MALEALPPVARGRQSTVPSTSLAIPSSLQDFPTAPQFRKRNLITGLSCHGNDVIAQSMRTAY